MEVVIGGNRVGSGSKMKTSLNEYQRSTHNLSTIWRSSMGAGILYPCFVAPAMRGDTFEIDLAADCRTIPTKGPLFGSYKMQVDFYSCPIRLYQAILHNNPQAIGLKMSQVKLPKLKINESHYPEDEGDIPYKEEGKFSNSCLLKYLGISGIGRLTKEAEHTRYSRLINAVPMLAYYDIFKNYYANKQEEEAYFISGSNLGNGKKVDGDEIVIHEGEDTEPGNFYEPMEIKSTTSGMDISYETPSGSLPGKNFILEMYVDLALPSGIKLTPPLSTWQDVIENSTGVLWQVSDGEIRWTLETAESVWKYKGKPVKYIRIWAGRWFVEETGLTIKSFPLKNIDDMRYEILSHHTMGTSFNIDVDNHGDIDPYASLVYDDYKGEYTSNKFPMHGLVLKTYQNDIFNNWLNADWIEGENGISELTKVQVVDGKFSMDAINFATKRYNMLNRVIVHGNTYEDWQDVIYEEVARRQVESPMFMGGMSKEVVFDEVIQTAPSNVEGEDSVLGKLGGRGRAQHDQNGGHIIIKCDEACFIIGIVSLTPRVNYTQGNEFYMTELDSLDDMHKPGMDGIGYQDLIGERMAWFDTILNANGSIAHRSKIGKSPAWIDYMTNVDRAFGDFAEVNGEQGGFMVLNRNYEEDENGGIKDATTYVDPQKYNYSFAYTALDAQNFWCQINIDCTARRLMSARIIPNV